MNVSCCYNQAQAARFCCCSCLFWSDPLETSNAVAARAARRETCFLVAAANGTYFSIIAVLRQFYNNFHIITFVLDSWRPLGYRLASLRPHTPVSWSFLALISVPPGPRLLCCRGLSLSDWRGRRRIKGSLVD